MQTQAEKKAEPQAPVMRARDIIAELCQRGLTDLRIADEVGCAYITILNWKGKTARKPIAPRSKAQRDNLARLYREVTGKSVVVSDSRN